MATINNRLITRLAVIFLGVLMLFQGMTATLYYIELPANKSHCILVTDLNDPYDSNGNASTEIPETGDAESEEENSEKSDLKSRRLFELGLHLSFSYLDKQSSPPIANNTSVILKKNTPPPEV